MITPKVHSLLELNRDSSLLQLNSPYKLPSKCLAGILAYSKSEFEFQIFLSYVYFCA